MKTALRRAIAATAAGTVLVAASVGTAYADDVSNTLDASIDAAAEHMALTVGGATGSTTLVVSPANGDGKQGCNLTSSRTATFRLTSSNTAAATVSPSSVTFTSCGEVKTVTVTPVSAGSTSVSLTETANTTGASFNLAPATFNVTVSPRVVTNTPPVVGVTGFTDGSAYELGVDPQPTPACSVQDAEDSGESAVPTISTASDAYGVGTTTVTCAYTDAGQLTSSATASYRTVDTRAPVITRVSVLPSANAVGWNRGPVTVTWSCSDAGTGAVQDTVSATTEAQGADLVLSGQCRDHAGHSASDTVQDINVDLTSPTIDIRRSPAANEDGWNQGDVTVSWTCTDDLSGVTDAGGSTVLGEGDGPSVSGTCSDKAGNVASAEVTGVKVDSTPPVIRFESRTAPYDEQGWNNGDVTVTWTCTDGGSGVVHPEVRDVVSTAGVGQTASGTCRDLAGNTATAERGGINIDTTTPAIRLSRTPAPNHHGWSSAPVEVSWTCTDEGGSGVRSEGGSTTVGEGRDQSVVRSCTDHAGNTVEDSLGNIDVDLTEPGITISRTPAAGNAAGWDREDVTVSWTCTDALSGVTEEHSAVTLGEGEDQTVEGTCTDLAGNTSTASVDDIDVDKTKPVISMTRDPRGTGWTKEDVTVSWTCTDALSGAPGQDGAVTLGEGEDQSVARTCTDRAGNTVSASVDDIDIDRTAPTVSWIEPIGDGAEFYFGSVPPMPACAATDSLSGLAGGCSVSGYSTQVGTHTVSATAVDNAGNARVVTSTYVVKGWTGHGYYKPVDMGGVWNTVKNGSTVPLKFEVFAGATELTSTTTVSGFTAKPIACAPGGAVTDPVEFTTTGGTSFRYDTTAGQFVQNWQTPKKAGACYEVTTSLADGSSISAKFLLK